MLRRCQQMQILRGSLWLFMTGWVLKGPAGAAGFSTGLHTLAPAPPVNPSSLWWAGQVVYFLSFGQY